MYPFSNPYNHQIVTYLYEIYKSKGCRNIWNDITREYNKKHLNPKDNPFDLEDLRNNFYRNNTIQLDQIIDLTQDEKPTKLLLKAPPASISKIFTTSSISTKKIHVNFANPKKKSRLVLKSRKSPVIAIIIPEDSDEFPKFTIGVPIY